MPTYVLGGVYRNQDGYRSFGLQQDQDYPSKPFFFRNALAAYRFTQTAHRIGGHVYRVDPQFRSLELEIASERAETEGVAAPQRYRLGDEECEVLREDYERFVDRGRILWSSSTE